MSFSLWTGVPREPTLGDFDVVSTHNFWMRKLKPSQLQFTVILCKSLLLTKPGSIRALLFSTRDKPRGRYSITRFNSQVRENSDTLQTPLHGEQASNEQQLGESNGLRLSQGSSDLSVHPATKVRLWRMTEDWHPDTPKLGHALVGPEVACDLGKPPEPKLPPR